MTSIPSAGITGNGVPQDGSETPNGDPVHGSLLNRVFDLVCRPSAIMGHFC